MRIWTRMQYLMMNDNAEEFTAKTRKHLHRRTPCVFKAYAYLM
ncbi:hypothetical protein CAter282_1265 [Collimonas arenae]|uniref:Uncharacterized protein n=1 Tax=Collimonas arenae TaxID=279058 RepID=A0A127PMY0_9BURK|nr:hypothetical protein CAter10_1360 [Collimonas arenae]AMP09058.1 hypothetical protein CAter282_1265 [Collimonas arenae]